jgi:hypothetical protein
MAAITPAIKERLLQAHPSRRRKPLTIDPVLPGMRNDTLTRLIGRLIAIGLDRQTIELSAIGWWYQLPDKSDFSENEVLKIVESVHRTDSRNKETGNHARKITSFFG